MYKKTSTAIAILTLTILPNLVISQELNTKIYFEHDTIDAYVFIPQTLYQGVKLGTFHHCIKYKDSEGNKKEVSPNEALEVRLYVNNTEIRLVSVSITSELGILDKKGSIFLEYVKREGSLSYYKFYQGTLEQFYYEEDLSPTTVLRHDNGLMLSLIGINFDSKAIEFFNDCPELVQLILDKQFYRNIDAMALFYTLHCSNSSEGEHGW